MANTKRKPAPVSRPAQADLATLISAVLTHPEVPAVIYNGLANAVTDLFNNTARADQDSLSDSAAYIDVILKAHAREIGGSK